jgi:enoyl-CoA hydratase/carnithine racemase
MSRLDYAAEGGLATITIHNPARRNAMTLDMWRALPDLAARADADPAIRAIVLTGAGDLAFCAGADISQFGEARGSEAAVAEYDRAVAAGDRALARAAKPTIAVIRGLCFGGGLGLAMACDLRLARAGARFRFPAARLGLGYGYDGVRTLVRQLGHAVAADLLFSARIVEDAEAERLGLVNRLWPATCFEAEAAGYLAGVAANAPLTLMTAKRALAELARDAAERDREAVAALVAACFRSADYREGQAAFREKREPVFRGE